MTGTLKVTPDRLISASMDFRRHDRTVQTCTQQMMSIVNSLTGAWEGQAQQAYVSKFRGLQDDMQRIHSKISEHSTDLEQMARNYIQAENRNTQSFGVLKDDYVN